MVGGGRLSILPDAKTINFYGKSKTFPNYLSGNPNQSFDEINSELGFNTFAQQIVKDYLKEKGIGYKTKVECG
ncbi:hypothetical protein HZC32_02130 [Candidatus Woesearchaeota archaeon]|nr:hypothetical protein [Candidatus Woesearchaeota archaeon]